MIKNYVFNTELMENAYNRSGKATQQNSICTMIPTLIERNLEKELGRMTRKKIYHSIQTGNIWIIEFGQEVVFLFWEGLSDPCTQKFLEPRF